MSFSGLIGKNIEYSYSKEIHNMLGNHAYQIFSIDSEIELKEILEKNFEYLNITIPYKKIAQKYCDSCSEIAKSTGVINTLIKENGTIFGYNTDEYGFRKLLEKNNVKIKDKKCLIFGTGATSKTVKYVLDSLGASQILFLSRKPDSKASFGYQDCEIISSADIIVNTTPNSQENLIDFSKANHAKVFIDVTYNPLNSEMIKTARKNNMKAINGLYMLVMQAVKTYEIYTKKLVSEDKIDEIYTNLLNSHRNIVLIGHPFSGKSTIGAKLAQKINYKFIDIDQQIEIGEKLKIEEIFANFGEDKFREIEQNYISNYVNKGGFVLSLGGGAILHKNLMNELKKNSIFFNIVRPLNLIDESELINRPLVKSFSDLKMLIQQRSADYEMFSDYEIFNIQSIDDAINQILEVL